jgi:hypothetical protein
VPKREKRSKFGKKTLKNSFFVSFPQPDINHPPGITKRVPGGWLTCEVKNDRSRIKKYKRQRLEETYLYFRHPSAPTSPRAAHQLLSSCLDKSGQSAGEGSNARGKDNRPDSRLVDHGSRGQLGLGLGVPVDAHLRVLEKVAEKEESNDVTLYESAWIPCLHRTLI